MPSKGWIAGAVTAIAMALVPGPATAAPSAAKKASAAGTPVAQSVTRRTCQASSGGWSWVHNRPNGYVVGNCANGWSQYQDSSQPLSQGEYGGRVSGNFAHCGWILASNLTGPVSSTMAGCPAPSSFPDSSFMLDMGPSLNCAPGTCTDGTYTQTSAACSRYANVKPWLNPSAATDPLSGVPAGSTALLWRYVSRDGQWVMARNTTDGIWSFVNRGCLPGQLPHDWANGAFYGSQGTAFADVNGDGRADGIAANTNGTFVRLSTGDSWPVGLNNWTGGVPFYGGISTAYADVSGDGRADAIAVNSGGIAVSLSTGGSFASSSYWSGPFYGDRGTMFADVNADGRADAIAVNNTGIGVSLSTGGGFAAWAPWSGPLYGTRGTMFADVNADGRADAIVVNDSAVSVALNNGAGFNAPTNWSGIPFYGTNGTHFADVNGDHRADAIAVNGDTTTYRLSDGIAFGTNTNWTQQPARGSVTLGASAAGNGVGGDPPNAVAFADATGDGKADSIAVYGAYDLVTYAP